jgi:MoaA/NifB/PqqE/SkfB family radical SAM enzyme
MKKRVYIKTGFTCNNNCIFCVAANDKILGNRPLEDIQNDLREGIMSGCHIAVLSGGEVSIRKDFFEILQCAKSLGYTRITVQTNGRMFCNMDFCLKAKEAGMTEIYSSVHGHTSKLHDSLTRSEGSFRQSIRAIRNIKGIGLRIATNIVIVRDNYRHLPAITNMLIGLGVEEIQLAFVHPMGNAAKNAGVVVPRISLAAPYIQESIRLSIANGTIILVEGVPFCLLDGYPDHVQELYLFDTEVRGFTYDPDFTKTRKEKAKVKFEQCSKCSYDSICEGSWKEYPEIYGSAEFKPISGKAPTIEELKSLFSR